MIYRSIQTSKKGYLRLRPELFVRVFSCPFVTFRVLSCPSVYFRRRDRLRRLALHWDIGDDGVTAPLYQTKASPLRIDRHADGIIEFATL